MDVGKGRLDLKIQAAQYPERKAPQIKSFLGGGRVTLSSAAPKTLDRAPRWRLFAFEQVDDSSAVRQGLRVVVYCEQRRGTKVAYGRRRPVE